MTERFSFPDTVAGLTLMLEFSLSRRRQGSRTFARLTRVGPTVFHTLHVIPRPRPVRAVRLAGFGNVR